MLSPCACWQGRCRDSCTCPSLSCTAVSPILRPHACCSHCSWVWGHPHDQASVHYWLGWGQHHIGMVARSPVSVPLGRRAPLPVRIEQQDLRVASGARGGWEPTWAELQALCCPVCAHMGRPGPVEPDPAPKLPYPLDS